MCFCLFVKLGNRPFVPQVKHAPHQFKSRVALHGDRPDSPHAWQRSPSRPSRPPGPPPPLPQETRVTVIHRENSSALSSFSAFIWGRYQKPHGFLSTDNSVGMSASPSKRYRVTPVFAPGMELDPDVPSSPGRNSPRGGEPAGTAASAPWRPPASPLLCFLQ